MSTTEIKTVRFKGYTIEIVPYEGKFHWIITEEDGCETHAIDDLGGILHNSEKACYNAACEWINDDIVDQEYRAMKSEGKI